MFEHLNWSKTAMRSIAGAEVAGGTIMMFDATKRLGGAIVAAASAALLYSEMRHGDGALAAPRGVVLVFGVLALLDR